MDTQDLLPGDIVFVNGEFLDYFFNEIHPHLEKNYILITHNNLSPIPGKYVSYLYDDKFIAWFGKNAETNHLKMRPIPIGIANAYWPHGNIELIKKQRSFQNNSKDKLLWLFLEELSII